MAQVHNSKTNQHGSPSDYYQQITLEMLNPFESFENDPAPVYKVDLWNCWPSSVGALDLAYDSKEVSQFSVTFQYNYHQEESL